MNQKNKQI